MALTQPALIPQPWGSDGQVGNIPQDSSEFGKASWAKGFPTETAQPLTEGGIPPSYLDFQGVLNALSAHAVFMQSGAHYAWSNTLDYSEGCFVLGSDGKLYQALQASGPGYSAGAKNPTTSATYWQVATFADYLSRLGGSVTGDIDVNGAKVLTTADSSLIAGYAMPSNNFDNLTLGASGADYTAPANGYFFLNKQSGNGAQYAQMYCTNPNRGVSNFVYNTLNMSCYLLLPVKTGDVVRVNYTLSGLTSAFRFYYAEGVK